MLANFERNKHLKICTYAIHDVVEGPSKVLGMSRIGNLYVLDLNGLNNFLESHIVSLAQDVTAIVIGLWDRFFWTEGKDGAGLEADVPQQ